MGMEDRLKRVLACLSADARMTTRDLGRALSVSQQAASYAISRLEERSQIRYTIVLDPARFGLVSVLVLYHIVGFDLRVAARARALFERNPYTTLVESVSQGADLAVQYTVPNLSLFNKRHREALSELAGAVRIVDMHVVIVRHLFEPKYLARRGSREDFVLGGDRAPLRLDARELAVLRALMHDPRRSILSIAQETGFDAKSVVAVKRSLERRQVIRKYSIIPDHAELGIRRKLVYVQLDHDDTEMNRFVEFSLQHRNIVEVVKIIGRYDLIVTIEHTRPSLAVINDIRREFNVHKYWVMDSHGVHKRSFVPEAALVSVESARPD